MKYIAFDIDGSIAEEERHAEKMFAKPIEELRKIISELYFKVNRNYKIVIFTARSWTDYRMTEDWLKRNEIFYDILVCGKFPYDILYDDRSTFNIESIKEFAKNAR